MNRLTGGHASHLVERQVRLHHALQEASHGQRPATAETMPAGPQPYVTVSRQHGARGSSVAARVAELLGWALYDRELLELVAADVHLQGRLLEPFDERERGQIEECISGLMSSESAREHEYTRGLLRVLRGLGETGRVVVVGRGAHLVMPPDQGLRVRIVAPLDNRVSWLAQEERIPEGLARTKLDRLDRASEAWLRATFRGPSGQTQEPFDLELNSATLEIEGCAQLVLAALHVRCPSTVSEALAV